MWERKKIEEKFYEILEDVKRFLTSKDLLIFLFFLLITAFLWLLEALRKNYETVIQIPISYVNLPNDYIITNELPQKTRITILAEDAHWPGDIDVARAEAALHRAEERLAHKEAGWDMVRAEASLKRAMARLSAAK